MSARPRTCLTYYGGKATIADRIVGLMPPHTLYVEPFAGGLAVLFRKPRSEREIINDLDGAVVNFWRVVRDEPDALCRAVELTPYARDEWRACRDSVDEVCDPVERARRFVVLSDQSYARSQNNWSPPSLLRDRRGRWQPGSWANMPNRIAAVTARLRGICIENTDAIAMIGRHDVPGAVIYADPPYTGEHRTSNVVYRHDGGDALWTRLVDCLLGIESASILLSGYPCEATARLESGGWVPTRIAASKSSSIRLGVAATTAPETLWRNPRCVQTAQGQLAVGA